jgi:hypothetical protein
MSKEHGSESQEQVRVTDKLSDDYGIHSRINDAEEMEIKAIMAQFSTSTEQLVIALKHLAYKFEKVEACTVLGHADRIMCYRDLYVNKVLPAMLEQTSKERAVLDRSK